MHKISFFVSVKAALVLIKGATRNKLEDHLGMVVLVMQVGLLVTQNINFTFRIIPPTIPRN